MASSRLGGWAEPLSQTSCRWLNHASARRDSCTTDEARCNAVLPASFPVGSASRTRIVAETEAEKGKLLAEVESLRARVLDLLSWSDPVRTGAVATSSAAALALVSVGAWPRLAVAGGLAFYALLLCGLLTLIGRALRWAIGRCFW